MERGKRISLACVEVALLAGLFVWASCSREPVYQGNTLSKWLDLLGSTNSVESAEARNAVRSIGTNAVPYLIRSLATRDSDLKAELMSRFPRLRIKDEWAKRDRAFGGCFALGPQAAAAIPILEKIMNDRAYESDMVAAAPALAAIGPEALPALIKGASSRDSCVRLNAISALETLGPDAKPARVGLVNALTAECFVTRFHSAIALGNIGEPPKLWMPVLLEFLQHTNHHIRMKVAQALGRFGTNSVAAIPALRKAAQDPDAGVKAAAEKALTRIDSGMPVKTGPK